MNSSNDETKAHPGAAPAEPAEEMPPFDPPKKNGEIGVLGKYRILKELGRGGMGGIYLGYDERLKRRVAIKVMLPKFTANASAKERFHREALAASQLRHDNIVVIYDADEYNGIPYIAMEYLQGASLDQFLKKNPVAGISQTLRVGREICSALAVAHRMGAAHRDIKPSNIWLEAPLGKSKILDFGLVKWLNPLDEAKLTTSGAIIGSPAYMSPEQARGNKVDHRTDLFSVGAVLYRMCTGQLPFQGDNLMDLLMALGSKDPIPVQELNPRVPSSLCDLIHHLLQKNPDHRPQKAEEVAARLQEIADKRQQMALLAGSASHPMPKATTIRDTSPSAYTNTGEEVVAPIEVSPQDESAFDNLEDSHPNRSTKPPSREHPAIVTTRGHASATTTTNARTELPVSLTSGLTPLQQNRKLLFLATALIFVLTFVLTVVLVKLFG